MSSGVLWEEIKCRCAMICRLLPNWFHHVLCIEMPHGADEKRILAVQQHALSFGHLRIGVLVRRYHRLSSVTLSPQWNYFVSKQPCYHSSDNQRHCSVVIQKLWDKLALRSFDQHSLLAWKMLLAEFKTWAVSRQSSRLASGVSLPPLRM